MRNEHGLSVGWTDTRIGELIHSRAEVLGRFTYVLVTSIDSSTDLRTVPDVKEIVEHYDGCSFVGRGLKVPARVIGDIAGAFNLFSGFDEVWWFEEEPTLPAPDGLAIVAPLDLRVDDLPEGIERWMTATNCGLGVGDGIGMNFVTPDAGIARHLEAIAESAE